MAVKLVAILVLMVAVTMVSNVINYDAMVKMNHSIKDVTDSKVPDLQNTYNIQYSLEAVQKDFFSFSCVLFFMWSAPFLFSYYHYCTFFFQ
mgnify:CR=1 FL=1